MAGPPHYKPWARGWAWALLLLGGWHYLFRAALVGCAVYRSMSRPSPGPLLEVATPPALCLSIA